MIVVFIIIIQCDASNITRMGLSYCTNLESKSAQGNRNKFMSGGNSVGHQGI